MGHVFAVKFLLIVVSLLIFVFLLFVLFLDLFLDVLLLLLLLSLVWHLSVVLHMAALLLNHDLLDVGMYLSGQQLSQLFGQLVLSRKLLSQLQWVITLINLNILLLATTDIDCDSE